MTRPSDATTSTSARPPNPAIHTRRRPITRTECLLWRALASAEPAYPQHPGSALQVWVGRHSPTCEAVQLDAASAKRQRRAAVLGDPACLRKHWVEVERLVKTFQRGRSWWPEREGSETSCEVVHKTCNEYFAAQRERAHAGCDDDGSAVEVVIMSECLATM